MRSMNNDKRWAGGRKHALRKTSRRQMRLNTEMKHQVWTQRVNTPPVEIFTTHQWDGGWVINSFRRYPHVFATHKPRFLPGDAERFLLWTVVTAEVCPECVYEDTHTGSCRIISSGHRSLVRRVQTVQPPSGPCPVVPWAALQPLQRWNLLLPSSQHLVERVFAYGSSAGWRGGGRQCLTCYFFKNAFVSFGTRWTNTQYCYQIHHVLYMFILLLRIFVFFKWKFGCFHSGADRGWICESIRSDLWPTFPCFLKRKQRSVLMSSGVNGTDHSILLFHQDDNHTVVSLHLVLMWLTWCCWSTRPSPLWSGRRFCRTCGCPRRRGRLPPSCRL